MSVKKRLNWSLAFVSEKIEVVFYNIQRTPAQVIFVYINHNNVINFSSILGTGLLV